VKIIDLVQGSDEWCAYRASYFTASEASIMMACSKNVKRNELLHMKATGSEQEFSAWFQRNVLDKGHRIEANARSIAEGIVGEELYPVTAISDDGSLLASFDGITMLEDVGWECKQWNSSKAESVRAGEVPQEDYWQVVQQLVVSGAEKWLYMVTDGTAENTVSIWVTLDDFHASQLRMGWEQFRTDLEAYQPTEQTVSPQGEAPKALPVLQIDLTGAVTASNLPDFKSRAMGMIEGIKTTLSTDQDFADAAETVKFLQKGEKQLKDSKQAALKQTASIEELFSTIDDLTETMRQKRLHLDKLVKAEKENRRIEIHQAATKAFDAFLAQLDCAVEPSHSLNIAGAMKGKKTIATLQSAADDEVARAKVECQQLAQQVNSNQALLEHEQGEHSFLFADWRDLILKAPDDLVSTIKARIAEHREVEAKRLDAERGRIRQEEEAKAKAKDEHSIQTHSPSQGEPGHRPPIDTSRLNAAAESFKRGSDVAQPETVTITRKEYETLLVARDKLDALEAAGVDNWSGYDDAMEHLRAA